MTEGASIGTALILGLLGGAHCIGMCGGIAATVGMTRPDSRAGALILLLGYNGGRLLSYALAGALLGGLGVLVADGTATLILRTLAGLMLVAMGLYIAQWWKGLLHLERAGSGLWRYIRPFASRFLPARTPLQALALGLLWGWLPCGLVYSTLIWASAAGHWQTSALLMFCFGLGTLPAMLATGLMAAQLRQLLAHRLTQQLAGGLIILFGLFTLAPVLVP
ncbi:sulfite exporter TauE/SafE family protein [Marinobacterium rhizophilum]|uniref:sulfite exporter TauE/SafE family protein n=1 Tax=Marinobacterium rhizophilum TaxID=420402 RepID=UPI00036DCCA6|nr:sulfite exporter TauE/SafE family protein [Marinobacterium rhizophilum]